MKKKLTPVYTLFWACLTIVLFASYSSNPPNGYAGAPPTFATCASCHSAGSGTGNVVITGLPATLTPNTVYPITVTVNRTNTIPHEGGFQMVVLDANNNNAGILSNPGFSSTLQTAAGRTYFEHNPAQEFTTNDYINYTVNWTSPASGSGLITMYTAANLANGNSNSNGDNIVTTTVAGMMTGGSLIAVNITSSNVTCFGGSNGSATANPSGGGSYSYSWSNGANTQTAINLAAGTYTVTVTSSLGGNGTASVTVTQPPLLNASIINPVNINCFIPTGSATATGSGGTGGFSYVWPNGTTGPTVSNLSAGTHTVTVTDANFCTKTAAVTITPDIVLPASEAGPATQLTCSSPTVLLNGTGSSTGGNFNYLWITSNGNIVSGATTLTPTVNTVGTYCLQVTNTTNGCTATNCTNVTQTPALSASISSQTNVDCYGSNTGSATAAGSGGAGTYTYAWSNNATTAQINNLPAGTYTVTITGSDGCTATASATVTQPSALNANTTATGETAVGANDGSATAAPSGGVPAYTYAWTNGKTTQNITGLSPGNYTVTVTDANSCQATQMVTVSSFNCAGFGLNFTSSNPSCFGTTDGMAAANPSGGTMLYTFLWSNGETTAAIDGLGAGNFTVTIMDDSGCEATGNVTMTPPTSLNIVIAQQASVDCNGAATGAVNANTTGGSPSYTFSWSNGGSDISQTGLQAGTYTVTVTDINGCTGSETIEITQPPILSVDLLGQTNLECPSQTTGSISVNGAGGTPGYDFMWSNGSVNPTIQNLAAGSYHVTVSDVFDCTATLQVDLVVEPDTEPPIVLASGLTVSLDNDGKGSITPAMVNGGSSDNCNIDTIYLDTYDLDCENLGENIVTLTVIDAAGNIATDTTSVFVVDEIVPVILCPPTIVVATGTCEATVDYSAPNATDNCSNVTVFILSGPPSGSVFPSGTTEVTWGADDNHGNTVFCSFNVVVEIDFMAEASFMEPDCYGAANGSATAMPVGGVPPFGYEWNDPANQLTQTATGLSAGVYTVVITSSNGCVAVSSVEVTEPEEVTISLDEIVFETSFGMNGSISVSIEGGAGAPFTYEWLLDGAFFSNEEDLTGLVAGEYSLVVSDQNGCTETSTFVVERLTITVAPTLDARISLQPNPVSNELFVKFELPHPTDVHVQVFDLTGQSVQVEQRSLVLNETLSVDLSQAAPGIYLVRLVAGENVMMKSIVVSR